MIDIPDKLITQVVNSVIEYLQDEENVWYVDKDGIIQVDISERKEIDIKVKQVIDDYNITH